MALSLLEKSIALLSKKDYGCEELKQKLKQYLIKQEFKKKIIEPKDGFCKTEFSRETDIYKLNKEQYKEIEITINKLLEFKYLNDDKYIANYIQSKANAGYGPIKIKTLLKQKLFADSKIKQIFELADTNWNEIANIVFIKKFGRSTPIKKDFKNIHKQKNYLLQRGFQYHHIQTIFNNDIL